MAYWMTPTTDMIDGWAVWVSERPPVIRDMVLKYDFNPWKLYRLKSSNHRVTIYSFEEPADDSPPTLKVTVSGQFNFVAFERNVFGISPDDLEECDLPGPNEQLGSVGVPPEKAKELFLSLGGVHEDSEPNKRRPN